MPKTRPPYSPELRRRMVELVRAGHDPEYDRARVPHNGGAQGFARALLVRRSISDPAHLTFHLTHAPEGTALAELARVAGARWSVESLFEQAKGEVGLDRYEVPSWVGWHRHITPSVFALAHLAAVRKAAVGSVDPASLAADLLPVTVSEVRRLLAALAGLRPLRPEEVLHWSRWRRRHQQCARRAQWHRRPQRYPIENPAVVLPIGTPYGIVPHDHRSWARADDVERRSASASMEAIDPSRISA